MKKIIVLLLCLLGSNLLFAQENTVLGTGALSQTSKYAIQQIQLTSPGSYIQPKVNFGAYTVNQSLSFNFDSNGGVVVYGFVTSEVDLGSVIPLVNGHGTGATVSCYFLYHEDGLYYYEVYSEEIGSGYSPKITLSSSQNNDYQLYSIIDGNNDLSIVYYDQSKLNVYETAPTVSVGFGGAAATVLLEDVPSTRQNTAIGYQSLHHNISYGNVGLGFQSLYNAKLHDNIGIGHMAGRTLTDGRYNVFIGKNAGKGITNGYGNIVLGWHDGHTLPPNLYNSMAVFLGQYPRLFMPSSGNLMLGYGNDYADKGYRLDVNGNGRFTGKVQAQAIDGFEAVDLTANKVLEINSQGHRRLLQMPTSKAYNDVLAFNKKGYGIIYEESIDKINFSVASLNMDFFAQKAGTGAQRQIINGSSVKAVRWTFSGTMYTNSAWMALDYGWCNGTSVNVKIEHSADNMNWSTNHNSDYYLSTSGTRKYHYLTGMEASNTFRITITQNYGDVIRLSGIKLLTTRLGNQGAAPEDSYPYTWNKDGWIGINRGVGEPEYPLDVNGASRFMGPLIIGSAPVNSTGSFDLLTRNSSTGAVEKFAINLPASGGFDLHGITGSGNVTTNNIIAQSFGIRYSDGSTYQTIGADHTGLGTLYRSFITGADVPVHRFQGSGAADLLVVKNGGNVGIGIDNPVEKLAVNGKIRAREVKVEPVNGWPDYVFADNYKPLSLAEVSAFVKQHRHLPEVPSAKEVEQNGLELGEMNKLLLKKIEELTLHLIEKEEQLKGQEKEIASLRSEFMELKKLVGKSLRLGQEKK